MPVTELSSAIRMSCLLEASARKAGNVHPGASFEHLTYDDFVRSGDVVAPVLASAVELGVGPAVLAAVTETRRVCEHNTNLGIVLLLAPLAAVPCDVPLVDGLPVVLGSLTRCDTDAVYEAIRIASPRGLGRSESEDVDVAPSGTLVEVMALAAERDLIAAEYSTGFPIALRFSRWLSDQGDFSSRWETIVQRLQLELMANHPDTDIERKCDRAEAIESARHARRVLDAGFPEQNDGLLAFRKFDEWLRARGSLRNPGTTADLVTASLFAALRDGMIESPTDTAVRQYVQQM